MIIILKEMVQLTIIDYNLNTIILIIIITIII
jgi:hypothetical protein